MTFNLMNWKMRPRHTYQLTDLDTLYVNTLQFKKIKEELERKCVLSLTLPLSL